MLKGQGTAGKPGQQELEAAIYEQKAMKHAAALFSSFILFNPGPQVQGMVLPTFKIGLSTPVNGIKLSLPQAYPEVHLPGLSSTVCQTDN